MDHFNKIKDTAETNGCLTAIILCIITLGLAFGICCLEVWVCMLLWNWFVAGILGFAQITRTFWQMWGVKVLFGALFKSHNFSNNNRNE